MFDRALLEETAAPPARAVPEPGTLVLLAAAVLLATWTGRKCSR